MILAQVLKNWPDKDISVIVDGVSVFGDRFQIFRLSIVHGCRGKSAAVVLWVEGSILLANSI
ncbi:MAG: hypothetical protein AB1489_13525 [Acidobacteriota bacterium]